MCGVIGVFGRELAYKYVKLGLKAMAYRGKDASRIIKLSENSAIGHNLHSIVGRVPQPLHDKNLNAYFAANCEIYNWKELCKEHKIRARNDAELLFKLMLKQLQKESLSEEVLNDLDGVYAFSLIDLKNSKVFLCRDILGIKPLWYSFTDGFSFASEKKALEKIGCIDVLELNPRKILVYDLASNKYAFIERLFFTAGPELPKSEAAILGGLKQRLISALNKRIPKKKFGILFSGGIDATILAKLLKEQLGKQLGNRLDKQSGKLTGNKKDFVCYTAGFKTLNSKIKTMNSKSKACSSKDLPQDVIHAKKAAKALGLRLKVILVSEKSAEKMLKTIVPLIEDNNPVKVGVALTFFAACQKAKKDGCKVIFSGFGSDELFAGYSRYKSTPPGKINPECVSTLLKIYERDTYRDDVITMYHNLELRLPYLDNEFVKYSLRIPEEFKLRGMREGPDLIEDKAILRGLGREIGIPEEISARKKKAAQYGSNADKIIELLTRKNGFKSRSEYLRILYKSHNVRLAGLVSTGKDSLYALHVMAKQNYEICCIIGIMSRNPDSYMFHTPNIHLIKLQAEAMGIPLVLVETTGEKEKELEDLRKAINIAKEKHGAEGVITGALYSSYQRDRIETIADSIGMKIFSPLWHISPESEMREILNNGFEIILSSISAEGLDKAWLGRRITSADVDKLVELNKKYGINVAGEGGEYESLVLDCPMFKKRIAIKKACIVQENEFTAKIIVDSAELVDKG